MKPVCNNNNGQDIQCLKMLALKTRFLIIHDICSYNAGIEEAKSIDYK